VDDCTHCGEAWPCPTRRKELAAEHADEAVPVCVLQADHLMQAVDDLPDVPGDLLYRRFLRDWRQPRPARTPSPG